MFTRLHKLHATDFILNYRRGSWSSEKLNDLPRSVQLLRGRSGLLNPGGLVPESVLFLAALLHRVSGRKERGPFPLGHTCAPGDHLSLAKGHWEEEQGTTHRGPEILTNGSTWGSGRRAGRELEASSMLPAVTDREPRSSPGSRGQGGLCLQEQGRALESRVTGSRQVVLFIRTQSGKRGPWLVDEEVHSQAAGP